MKPVMICCTLWVLSLFAQAPDTVWTKTFGGIDADIGYDLQQTQDGGYIIVGSTQSFNTDHISIIDGVTNMVSSTTTAGVVPFDLTYNPVNNKIYCSNRWSADITVIDGIADSVVATVAIGDVPGDLVCNPSSNKVYCTNGVITVIDGSADTVLTTITVGTWPGALAYNPAENKIYSANQGSNDITIIDGAADTVITTVPAGDVPFEVIYNPANNRIYCSNRNSGNITVIDGSTNAVIATIDIGDVPGDLAYNSANNKIYCTNGVITVIDCTADTVLTTITVGMSPCALEYNSNSNKIYSADFNSGTVTVIDGQADTAIVTIPVGPDPSGLAYNSSNNKVYCAIKGRRDVQIIDGVTNTVLATASVGHQPQALTYNPVSSKIYCASQYRDKDAYIIRTNASGETMWEKVYGGQEDDEVFSIDEHWDGTLIIAGCTRSFGTGGNDLWVLKIDDSGDTLCTDTYGGYGDEWAKDVHTTSDSGYVIAGGGEFAVVDTFHPFLMKFDQNGDSCWLTVLSFIYTESFSVVQTSNGDYMTCGANYWEHPAPYLARIDTLGNPLWEHFGPYGLGGVDNFSSIIEAAPDTFVIVGPHRRICCGAPYCIYIVVGNGDIIYGHSYWEADCARAVQKTNDDAYVIAGDGNTCVYMLKTSQDTTLWTNSFGVHNDGAYAMQITPDEGYVVLGYTSSFGEGNRDVWLLKTEPDTLPGIEEYGEPSHYVANLSVHPNPFSTVTDIICQMTASAQTDNGSDITLRIYDVSGRLVRNFGRLPVVGDQSIVTWDGRDDQKRPLGNGIYFAKISAGNHWMVKKLLLVK